MKNSNKMLLIVVISLMACIIFAAIIMRINLGPKHSLSFTRTVNLVGKSVTKNFSVDNFSELKINGAALVSIKTGEKTSVTIAADEDCLDNINVSLMGSRLNIDTMHGIGKRSNKKVVVSIVTNQPLKKITTSGASHLDYENITGNELILAANGASDCYLSGKINYLQIKTSGTSHVDAKNLIADDVGLETSGAADVVVHAKKSLKVNASGTAHINYYGKPKNIMRSVSGMASINSGG